MHDWIKVKLTDLQKDLGLDLYECINCKKGMSLSGYAAQGMPPEHSEACPKQKGS